MAHEHEHEHQPPVPTAVLDGADEDYPSDARYWYVAIFLFCMTLIEISTYVWQDSVYSNHTFLVTILLVLMAIKFWTVGAYFMHLKYDKKVLTVAFYAGIALALTVYLCMLLAFRFFGDNPAVRPV